VPREAASKQAPLSVKGYNNGSQVPAYRLDSERGILERMDHLESLLVAGGVGRKWDAVRQLHCNRTVNPNPNAVGEANPFRPVRSEFQVSDPGGGWPARRGNARYRSITHSNPAVGRSGPTVIALLTPTPTRQGSRVSHFGDQDRDIPSWKRRAMAGNKMAHIW